MEPSIDDLEAQSQLLNHMATQNQSGPTGCKVNISHNNRIEQKQIGTI